MWNECVLYNTLNVSNILIKDLVRIVPGIMMPIDHFIKEISKITTMLSVTNSPEAVTASPG